MSGCVIAETSTSLPGSRARASSKSSSPHGRANDRVPTHVYLDRALQPFCGLCVHAREEPTEQVAGRQVEPVSR